MPTRQLPGSGRASGENQEAAAQAGAEASSKKNPHKHHLFMISRECEQKTFSAAIG
jgi:hypothetical protein